MKIFADFNNADNSGRVRLNTHGSLADIERVGILLKPGLELILTDYDELETVGFVEFSAEEKIWVAKIHFSAESLLQGL